MISVGEASVVLLLAGLLLGAVLWRYAWARRLAAIVIVMQVGWVIGGDAYAVAVLAAAIGVWAVASVVRGLKPRQLP